MLLLLLMAVCSAVFRNTALLHFSHLFEETVRMGMRKKKLAQREQLYYCYRQETTTILLMLPPRKVEETFCCNRAVGVGVAMVLIFVVLKRVVRRELYCC